MASSSGVVFHPLGKRKSYENRPPSFPDSAKKARLDPTVSAFKALSQERTAAQKPKRPYSHNPSNQLSRNVEKTFTRIFSGKPKKEDLKMREMFHPVRPLNKGGYATVFEGTDKDGKPVALKFHEAAPLPAPPPVSKMEVEREESKEEMPKAKFDPSRFQRDERRFQLGERELAISQKAQTARHATKTIAGFESAPFEFCHVMELAAPDLHDLAFAKKRRFTLQEIGFIATQLLEHLSDLAKMGVVHCDLKPENISIDPKTLKVKVLDFGSARECTDNKSFNFGTPSYSSPELLLEKPFSSLLDIWNLGVILVNIYCGEFIVDRFESSEGGSSFTIFNDHLHNISRLIGMPPGSLIQQGALGRNFFTKKDRDYLFRSDPSDSAFLPKPGYIKEAILKRAKQVGDSPEHAAAFIAFADRMIAYEERRSSADELLQDPFLVPRSSGSSSTS